MGTLKKKIKKCDMYFIEIEDEDLMANNLQNVENIVLESEEEHENKLHELKEYMAKLETINLEFK